MKRCGASSVPPTGRSNRRAEPSLEEVGIYLTRFGKSCGKMPSADTGSGWHQRKLEGCGIDTYAVHYGALDFNPVKTGRPAPGDLASEEN
jgi:hypothetical protein